MKMVEVTVIKTHPYGRNMHRAGQVCLVEQCHVELLEKAGLIAVTEVPVVKKPLEVTEADEDETPKEKKRRTYRRRDLRAEEA